MIMSSYLFAHTDQSGIYSFLTPQPQLPIRFFYNIDPTWFFFVFMAVLYFRGYVLFHRKPIHLIQLIVFTIGITINCFVLSPWFDDLASQLFFVHMIQHLAVIIVGTPLIICGAPIVLITKACHPWVLKKLYHPIIRSKLIRSINNIFSTSWVGLIFFQANFWFWHIPRWYDLALLNDYFHIIEHALMAISSIYLWRNIIDPYPMTKSPLSMSVRIGFLASFMITNIILSATITFSQTVWYSYDLIPMPQWWEFSRLDDQRLGGLIMWIPGGMIIIIAMTACFFAWVKREYDQEHLSNSSQPTQSDWKKIFTG